MSTGPNTATTAREFGVYEEIALLEQVKALDLEFDQERSEVDPWDSRYEYAATYAKGGNVVSIRLREFGVHDSRIVTDQALVTISEPGDITTKSSPTRHIDLVMDRKVESEGIDQVSYTPEDPALPTVSVAVAMEVSPNKATYVYDSHLPEEELPPYPTWPTDPDTGEILIGTDEEGERMVSEWNVLADANKRKKTERGDYTFTRQRYNDLVQLLGSLTTEDKF